MRDSSLEEKLTAAARQALDELVEDYRNRILVGAMESASTPTGELREISVRDILVSVDRSQKRQVRPRQRNAEVLARLYAMVGLAVGSVGLAIYVYQKFLESQGTAEWIGLMLVTTGLLLSIASLTVFYAQRLKSSERGETRPSDVIVAAYSAQFLKQWLDTELAVRSFVASRLGESTAKEPFSLLAERLKTEGILSSNDEQELRRLLAVRNEIAHRGMEISRERFEELSKSADALRERIQPKLGR